MMMLNLAFRNLFRNVRRTIAILMTVAIGAGALFCFQGFIHGVLTDYKDSTIHSHHGNGQINTEGYRETVFEDPWNHWINNYDELEYFLYDQEGVMDVFPRISVPGMLTNDKASITGSGQGIIATREAEFFDGLNIEIGETLYDQPNGILLGKGLANALDVVPGDQLTLYTKGLRGKIGKAKLEVTGIFHTGSMDFDSRVFRIQLDKAQELLRTNSVESVSIGLEDHAHWDKIANAVEGAFPSLEATSFDVLDKVYYQNSVDWLNGQFHVVQVIILGIVLLGIFNTISASILERKQEIGNLRANGESSWSVLRLIVAEGAFLGLLGGIIGLGLTYLVSMGLLHHNILMPPGPGSTKEFFLQFSFTFKMFLLSLSLSVISAVAASALAGLKVARMPIAKALRSS